MIPKALSVKLSRLTSSAAEPSCAECSSKRDSSEATFTRVQSFVCVVLLGHSAIC